MQTTLLSAVTLCGTDHFHGPEQRRPGGELVSRRFTTAPSLGVVDLDMQDKARLPKGLAGGAV